MLKSKCKSLILAVVLLGILGMSATEAQAGWWHRWGYWGYPSYTYYSGYSGWYAGVRPAPVYRWAYRPYRWYRGYAWGGRFCATSYCGSPCYNTCCYEPCCGSTVTTYSPGAPTAAPQAAPAPMPAPPQQQPAPALPKTPAVPPSTGPQTNAPVSADSGLLTIRVPDEAQVYVNGYKTKSTGAVRQFVSNGLKPGFSYKYEVRAEMVRDGRLVEDTQVIYLRAGATERVAFSFDARPAQRLATIW